MSAVINAIADLLDSAITGNDKKLTDRELCEDCAALPVWCGECQRLEDVRDALGAAFSAVARTDSDAEAQRIFMDAMGRLSGLTRFGVISGTIVKAVAA